MVKLTINGIELEAPQGELIVETVKRLGLEIPVFCYHPRMKAVGMCRMCLVETGFKQPDGSVRMMPKPQAGCTLPASEGLVVVTDSEAIHRDRKGVLEFLLINHPLDCPICDRGGECPLQNNTMAYGPSTTRFIEMKRHLPKAFPLSQYVTLDLERCIQCGRCVRFTEEISGDSDLAFRFRGAEMQPSTFQLTDFESRFSGNVIEICPVGALTSAKYRFRARPWDLETSPGVCTECSNGCNVWFDHRAGKQVRINGRANDGVNEEWTCDKGKFGHDWYNSTSRLTKPLVRRGDQFVPASWSEAYEEILAAFADKGGKVAGLTGPRVSNEGLFLFKRLFSEAFGSDNVDHRWRSGPVPTGPVPRPLPIASLESKRHILVFGTHLAEDLPIVHLRVRKAWSQSGATVDVAYSAANEVERFAKASLRCRPGAEAALAKCLLGEAVWSGKATVSDAVRAELAGFNADSAEEKSGVSGATVRAAAARLGEGAVVLTSDRLLDAPEPPSAWKSLKALAEATGSEFVCYPTGTNAAGAELLGLVPDHGLSTWQILEGCKDGKIEALWLVEADPSSTHDAALETVPFLVYQGTLENEAMAYASVVLPMAAPAEQDGTWTNCEGRVQRFRQAIAPPGEAKPAWRVFAECLLRARPSTPFFNPGEVMEEIARVHPVFAPAQYSLLPEEGALVARESLVGEPAGGGG